MKFIGKSLVQNQNLYSCYFLLTLLIVLTLNAGTLLAASKTPTPTPSPTPSTIKKPAVPTIQCPPVIAERSAGKYGTTRTKRSNYQCYRTEKDAKRAGYYSAKALEKMKFEGWYRINFNHTKSSCGGPSGAEGPVFFMQVVEHGKAIYTDFCPSTGRQIGVRTSSGISTSHISLVREIGSTLKCKDGIVERSEHLELTRAVDGASGFNARMVIVQRCPDIAEGMLACTTEYTGIGFKETHTIWPDHAINASAMQYSCGEALKTCSQCHENLQGINMNP